MSGIYPSGAVPSYRSSSQTVIVHHWSPAWTADEILAAHPSTNERLGPDAGESVIPYNAECSVPLKIVVRETEGTAFRVEDIPAECPLCHRRFSPFDAKRIRNAAISQHLRLCEWRDEPLHPTDLILDV